MSDTEDLFNFVPVDPAIIQRPGPKTLGLDAAACRKRSRNEPVVLSYIKKPVKRATKVIKIELYDAEKSVNSMCDCEADMCVQYATKGVLFDEIYSGTMDIISKIQDKLDAKL